MYEVTPSNVWIHRRHSLKDRERNIPSALLSILLIVVVATALAQPRWFYLKGGGCTRKFIGVQEFFFIGNFQAGTPTNLEFNKKDGSLIYYGLNEKMKDCVTPEIVNVQRAIISLCFLSMLCTLCQFFMDLLGVRHRWFKSVRRNGIGSIITVILTVAVIGLCFYVSELMKTQQERTKIHPATSVEINFAVSYYLIIGASVIGVFAAAANLLRRYPIADGDDNEILLDDCQGETFSVALPHSHSWSNFHHQDISHLQPIPPPPPYTP